MIDRQAECARRSVVLISYHVYDSPRRAGFHWLADAFRRDGWDVTFVTTAVSQVTRITGDRRAIRRAWGRVSVAASGVKMLIEPALIHPFDLRSPLLNRLIAPVMGCYGKRLSPALCEIVADADMIIFESSSALLLFDAVRRCAPKARLVYRVSDDVRAIRNSPLVHAAEDRVVNMFDCVSVPSRILIEQRFPGLTTARFHPHGLEKSQFDGDLPNPLANEAGANFVSVGSTLYDYDFIRIAAERHPAITFHLVGDVEQRVHLPNLRYHGEVPFAVAAGFTKFADVCLAPYRRVAGNEYLVETSNKIAQYTYAQKAIVTPSFLTRLDSRPHLFGYDIDHPESVDRAITAALAYDTAGIDRSAIGSWESVRDAILRCTADADSR